MGAFVRLFRRIADRWLLFRAHQAARRELLADIDRQLTAERERHQREEDRLKDEVKVRDRHIELLSGIIDKHQAYLERDTAIAARRTAEAQEKPPGVP